MTDTTVDIAKKVIVNYKDITSWILLLIIIVIGIIRYIQNVKLAKTVETFKSELSKSEIKFTRHTELQIECIKNYYDLLVTLHFGYTSFLAKENHHSLKKSIKATQEDFIKLLMFSHRNQILLTDEIVEQYKIVHDKFKIWNKLSTTELNELSWLEERDSTEDTERLYRNPQEEAKSINQRIKTINTNKDVKSIEDEIFKLRKIIEDYFKQLVG